MSACGHHYPVQILRSPPETQHNELQVVDFGLDAATAPPGTPAVPRLQGRFCLPPSPPYTNSHLRRAIPLPFFDDCASKTQTGSMESEQDAVQRVLLGTHGSSSILSPPYSPHRRVVSLVSVDEDEETADSCAPPTSAGVSSAETDGQEGQQLGDFDALGPPSPKLKDLDLGDELDDWDEPLFLNAPSVLRSSDGLALNLFGAIYCRDDEDSPRRQLDPPPSPTIHSSSLPDFDDDLHERGKPLFDPSDFDVFENGWDTITSDATQSSSFSSEASSQDTPLDPFRERLAGFDYPMEPFLFAAPTSPSRRNVINLPGDEISDPAGLETLMASLAIGRNEMASRLCDQIPSSHAPYSPEARPPFNITTEVVQTPFSIPLLLPSSVSKAPSYPSLLFAALEPQDIPLPESPEIELPCLQSDYNAPLHMSEEGRIRLLHQEMLGTEAQTRNREGMLTEYIARLNAMKPPSLPSLVPVYCTEPQPEGEGSTSTLDGDDLLASSGTSQPQGHNTVPLVYTQPYTSGRGPSTSEFLQARRREVQNAMVLRAAERRRRKRTKERIRELDALLQLKAGPLCSEDAWTLAAPRGRRGRSDEAIVLFASGSDRHPAHTTMLFENEFEHVPSQRERRDEVMQLVAKMVFRRRDSSRPLSGKTTPVVREYVRSGLSRSIFIDDADGDETSNEIGNTLMS